MKFNEKTTASEAVEGYNLTGYNVLVTGGNSGIGVETVRVLAKAGATVYFTSRNVENGNKVRDDLIQKTGNSNIFVEQLELDSIDNVNAFVKRFLSKNVALHILINNAGIMACPLGYTKDGIENQFGTNHLGHFALTVGLLPCLKEAYKQSGRFTRVVNLSSVGHGYSDIDFDDFNFKTREYDAFISYGQSKTANCLFSLGLTEKYASEGIYSNSVMPGVIMTNLGRHMDQAQMQMMATTFKKLKSVEEGAATSVWAAVAKELDGKGGLYLENCQISEEKTSAEDIRENIFGYLSHIMNVDNAKRLWDLSEKLIKRD